VLETEIDQALKTLEQERVRGGNIEPDKVQTGYAQEMSPMERRGDYAFRGFNRR